MRETINVAEVEYKMGFWSKILKFLLARETGKKRWLAKEALIRRILAGYGEQNGYDGTKNTQRNGRTRMGQVTV